MVRITIRAAIDPVQTRSIPFACSKPANPKERQEPGVVDRTTLLEATFPVLEGVMSLMNVLVKTLIVSLLLGGWWWTAPPGVRKLTSQEAAQASGADILLINRRCELVDTQAACDIEGGTTGGSCAGLVLGAPCSTCIVDPAATNESWFCLRTLEVNCMRKTTGAENTCGDKFVGTCAFDPNFILFCSGSNMGVCPNILQVGC